MENAFWVPHYYHLIPGQKSGLLPTVGVPEISLVDELIDSPFGKLYVNKVADEICGDGGGHGKACGGRYHTRMEENHQFLRGHLFHSYKAVTSAADRPEL